MPAVFISYSRRDAEAAERVRAALEHEGVDVWIDQEDIPPAADWMDQIRDAIDASDVFVVVLSPAWVASDVCATEIEWAVDGGKQVVPVVVAEVDPASVDHRVASLNWVFLRETDDRSAGIGRVLQAARADLEWSEFHAELLRRARQWSAGGEGTAGLLRGQQLERAERELAVSRPHGQPQAVSVQRAFVQASRNHRSSFLRRLLVGVAAALAVSLALGVVAVLARNESERQRQVAEENAEQARLAEVEAEQQATRALAGQLEAEAASEVERDVAAGLLVAAAAYVTNPTDEHRLGIANALAPYADVVAIHPDDELAPLDMIATADGVTIVTRSGTLMLDPTDGNAPARSATFDWDTTGADFDVVRGALDRVAVVMRRGELPELYVVAIDGGEVLWRRTAESFLDAEVLDGDATIAVTDASGTLLFDAVSGAEVGMAERRAIPFGPRAARGELVAVGEGEVRLARTGEFVVDLRPDFRTDTPVPFDWIHTAESLEFDPTATVLAIGGNDGSVWFGDVAAGTVAGFGEPVHGGTGVAVPVVDLAFDATGAQLVSLGSDGTIGLWADDRGFGRELRTVRPGVNGWGGRAVALTGGHIVVATDRGVVVRTQSPSGSLSPTVRTWPFEAYVGAGDGEALVYDGVTGQLVVGDRTLSVSGRVVAADAEGGQVAYLSETDDGGLELVSVDAVGEVRTVDVRSEWAQSVSIGETSVLVVADCSVEIVDLARLESDWWASPCEIGRNRSGDFAPGDVPVVRRTLSIDIDERGDRPLELLGFDAVNTPDGDWIVATDDRIRRSRDDGSSGTSWADGRFDRLAVGVDGAYVLGVGRRLSAWELNTGRPALSIPIWDGDGACLGCEISADVSLERIDVVGLIDWSTFARSHVSFDLSADALIDAVCDIARRDLTVEEWRRFEVGDRPVPSICAGQDDGT